jgi:hypothetical protein
MNTMLGLTYITWRLCTSVILPTDGREALKVFTAMSFVRRKDIYVKMAASLGPVPCQTKSQGTCYLSNLGSRLEVRLCVKHSLSSKISGTK